MTPSQPRSPHPHVPVVALRTIEDADLAGLFAQACDPQAIWMAAFTPAKPYDRATFDARMHKFRHSPDITTRAVTRDGHLVGSIASFVIEGDTEITYWLDRAVWGGGIATRALALFLDLVTVRPLHAHAASDNTGSLAVLRKSNFTTIGTEISFAPARGVEIEETILRLD